MTSRTVQSRRKLTQHPDRIWRRICDFDLAWHPDVTSCQVMRTATGGVLRAFRDRSGQLYEEQRTYISHSDRVLCYAAVSGIEGVFAYSARVEVAADPDGGAVVTWQAEFSAVEARADAIAAGTGAIFGTALDTLAALTGRGKAAPKVDFPTPSQLREGELDGVPRLSYITGDLATDDHRPLVVLLHGIGGQASNWRPQLAALGSNYRMLALNLRGYGRSTLGPQQTEIGDYCDDILRLAEHLDADKLVLVGLSYGSWIATSFALRYPEKLAGLVLAGGCTGMSEAGPEERESFRTAREVPLDAGQSPADFAPAVVDVIAGPHATQELRETLRSSMAKIPAATYRDALRCFCNPTETFDFAKIAAPVLLMTGAHDRLAPPSEIRRVSERMLQAGASREPMPDIGFEVLPGAGHVCNLEAQDDFNFHLARFLSRLPGVARDFRPDAQQRQLEKRQRILQAAHDEFCSKGFDGAAMEVIARRAEVSKPTLYHYFDGKEGLFAAVLEAGRSHIVTPLLSADGDLVDRLWTFSWVYADFVLRPDMLSLARLILGEASRKPESAAAYHKGGPGLAFEGLVEFVKASVARGDLMVEAPEHAAQHLWSLILSGPRDHYLHFAKERPGREELLASISHGLRAFIKVYSARPEADLRKLKKLVAQEANQKG